MAKKKGNQTIIKTIGDDNVLIKDCPVLIPEENIDMFLQISSAADDNSKRWENYPNSYKKKVIEHFVKASNRLNEAFDFNNIELSDNNIVKNDYTLLLYENLSDIPKYSSLVHTFLLKQAVNEIKNEEIFKNAFKEISNLLTKSQRRIIKGLDFFTCNFIVSFKSEIQEIYEYSNDFKNIISQLSKPAILLFYLLTDWINENSYFTLEVNGVWEEDDFVGSIESITIGNISLKPNIKLINNTKVPELINLQFKIDRANNELLLGEFEEKYFYEIIDGL